MILDCYNALKRMEQRPAMWTGENTLNSMAVYVRGYNDALTDTQLISFSTDPFFDWVANKLGYFESTAGWANMILAFSLGYDTKNLLWEVVMARMVTEEEHLQSIKLFYILLEEYKADSEL